MAGNALSSGTLPGCQAPQQATLLALRGIEEQPWPHWTDGETEAQTHHTYRRVKRVRNTEGLSWGASEGHDLLYAQVFSQELGPTEVFWWLGPILKDPDGSGTEANREGALVERSSWPLPNLRPCKRCPFTRQRQGAAHPHLGARGPAGLFMPSTPNHHISIPWLRPGQRGASDPSQAGCPALPGKRTPGPLQANCDPEFSQLIHRPLIPVTLACTQDRCHQLGALLLQGRREAGSPKAQLLKSLAVHPEMAS